MMYTACAPSGAHYEDRSQSIAVRCSRDDSYFSTESIIRRRLNFLRTTLKREVEHIQFFSQRAVLHQNIYGWQQQDER